MSIETASPGTGGPDGPRGASRPRTIGWIGAGKMGGPMIRRLVVAGHRLVVSEPDAENRAAAAAAGAETGFDVPALAAEADIVFSMIPNDIVLAAVVLGEAGLAARLAPGAILVEMSTVSPAISRKVAAALAERGIGYVRAPVSGSTTMAEAGTLSVLASGPRAAYDAVEPLLAHLSARRFHVGEDEQARYLKLVLNTLVGGTASLVAEALALGRRGDIDIRDMMEVICQSAVASPLIGYKRALIESGDYTPAFTVAQMMKDFDIIIDTARADHVPMFVSALVRQQYESAYPAAAERDFFVLCEEGLAAAE